MTINTGVNILSKAARLRTQSALISGTLGCCVGVNKSPVYGMEYTGRPIKCMIVTVNIDAYEA